VLAELEALEIAVKAVAGLDVSVMTGMEAVELVTRLGTATGVLDGVRIPALATVKASGVWGLDGSRSAKAWLVRTTGCSELRAGSELKLADRLSTILPRTAEALVDGAISVEHALTISRLACDTDRRVEMLADPECGEKLLLSQAHLCVDEYKKAVARWGLRVDPDAGDEKNRVDRALHSVELHDTLGGGDLHGFMSPVGSATLRAALDAFMGKPIEGDPRTPGQRRHDALVALAQRALDGGTLGRHASVRPQIVVGVQVETLVAPEGTVGLEPAMLLNSGTPIPRTVLDWAACDAEVTRIVFGPEGQVLDLGRSERVFKGPLRRALDARDGGCRRPGCHQPPDRTEGHHLVYWRHGGVTSLDNGALLCLPCHIWAHTNDIVITKTPDGGLAFHDRHGRYHGTSYPRGLTR
jgi:Domain of unknown function (DUF222)/HNH endonuclease